MALSQETTPGFPSNLGGTVKKVDIATPVDNVFTYSSAGQVWQRIFDGGNSVYRASWLFITGAPADKTALVNIALAASAIGTLEIDVPITLNGSVAAAGKTIVVQPGGLISGTGTIDNVVLSGNATQQLAATTLTFTNAKNATGKWLPTQFGATGDGVTDDYVAINFTNTVANANSQKIISLLPGTYNIGTNLAISSGVLLNFEHGAIIDGAVTLSGSTAQFKADSAQKVFGSLITVSGIYPVDAIISPMNFGAVGNGIADDSPPIQKMWDYVATLTQKVVNIFIPARTYLHGSTVFLPKTNVTTRFIKIEGYGATLRTEADSPIWSRHPSSTAESTTLISSYIATIRGLYFQGNASIAVPQTNQIGLDLGSLYSWVIEDCYFSNLYHGIAVYFGLNCQFTNLRFFRQVRSDLLGRYGDWPGASISNSSFNANTIQLCRSFSLSGSFTTLEFYGADQTVVKNYITEGQNPIYNFYMDDGGNTGVLINRYEDIWIESVGGVTPINTNFYLKMRSNVYLKNIQRTHPNKFLEWIPYPGSTLLIDGCPYWSNGPADGIWFDAGGDIQTGRYIKFINNPLGSGNFIYSTSSWAGGILPINLAVEWERGTNGGTEIYRTRAYTIISHGLGLNGGTVGTFISASTNTSTGVSITNNTASSGAGVSIAAGGSVRINAQSSTLGKIFMQRGAAEPHANLTTGNFNVVAEGNPNFSCFIASSNTGSYSSQLILVRSRGTSAAPSKVENGDTTGVLFFSAYDGSATQNTAVIYAQVSGSTSAGNVPTDIIMGTGTSGASRPERLRITSGGKIRISDLIGTGTRIVTAEAANGELSTTAIDSIVATGAQYQLGYYAAAGNKVSPLTLITGGRALKSDANGLPVAFDTATEPSLTELSYVKGVTSAIQPQFGTKGLYAANGDGILTTFTVTHVYTGTPTNVQVTPAGVDSAIPLFVSNITGTTFDVTFTSAPIVGTNNVTFYWTAK